jgi:hypothetical protein
MEMKTAKSVDKKVRLRLYDTYSHISSNILPPPARQALAPATHHRIMVFDR